MGTFKVRQNSLQTGGFTLGSGGTKLSGMMFGSASFAAAALGSGSSGSAVCTVAGLPVTASVIGMPGTSTGSFALLGLNVTAVNTMGASFANFNSACTATAKTFNVTYLAIW